jgi:hypothetical protein
MRVVCTSTKFEVCNNFCVKTATHNAVGGGETFGGAKMANLLKKEFRLLGTFLIKAGCTEGLIYSRPRPFKKSK